MDEEKVYCSMYSRNAELYHHGIKGQKWGVTNGPPYPLDSSVSTGKSLKNSQSEGFSNAKKVTDDMYKKFYNTNNIDKRWKNVAEFGIAALNSIGKSDANPLDTTSQLWFLFEDQTTGYPVIGALLANGAKYKDVMQEINKYKNKSFDDKKLSKLNRIEQELYFAAKEGIDLEEFADAFDYVKDAPKMWGKPNK